MFDAQLRRLVDPLLVAVAGALARSGVSANALTFAGLLVGLAGAVVIGLGAYGWGLAMIFGNRLLDGLDGAVARINGPTDIGGYYDIVADFVFYVSVPLAFGVGVAANLPYALVLVASFILTGVSFLAFAAIAARREAQSGKAIVYSTGLAEGGETILAFAAMCVFPGAFPVIASVFAGLCVATVFQRTLMAVRLFR